MNLIEQLGGYEAAKKIAENTPPKEIHQTEFFDEHGNYYANDCGDLVVWGGYGWLGVEGNCPTLHCIDYLIYILLQYRRQHNIFEINDQVVLINKPGSSYSLHRVLAVNAPTTIHVCPINQVSGSDLVVLGFMASPYYLRHATDAEFAANKRLEVD